MHTFIWSLHVWVYPLPLGMQRTKPFTALNVSDYVIYSQYVYLAISTFEGHSLCKLSTKKNARLLTTISEYTT